jgi:hypothetical protein
MKIWESPLSMLRNVDGGPPGGAGAKDPRGYGYGLRAGAEDLGARWAPWEVPELKIRERPPSTLRNIDSGPPERCQR